MSPSIAQWLAAGAAVGTLVVAIAASIIGFIQLRQAIAARQQAEKQHLANRQQSLELERRRTQPSVVVSLESSGAGQAFRDIVIRNYGLTPARDVRPVFEPSVRRTSGASDGHTEEVVLPQLIPFLAPGQEFRALWDVGHQYLKSELPMRIDVSVTYVDVDGNGLGSTSVLDWDIFRSVRYIQVYGLHDAAKALRGMEKRTKSWTERHGELSVIARDGDRRDAAQVREVRRWQAEEGDESEAGRHPRKHRGQATR